MEMKIFRGRALLFLSVVSFLASHQVLIVHIVVFPCDVTKTVVSLKDRHSRYQVALRYREKILQVVFDIDSKRRPVQ